MGSVGGQESALSSSKHNLDKKECEGKRREVGNLVTLRGLSMHLFRFTKLENLVKPIYIIDTDEWTNDFTRKNKWNTIVDQYISNTSKLDPILKEFLDSVKEYTSEHQKNIVEVVLRTIDALENGIKNYMERGHFPEDAPEELIVVTDKLKVLHFGFHSFSDDEEESDFI